MLSLWGAVWAEQPYSPATALEQGLWNQSDLQSEKCIIVHLGAVYRQSMRNVGGVVPFLPIPPFEISCLDEVWEVNAFKYIPHPLFFCSRFIYSPSQNTWIRSKIKEQKYHVLSWLGSPDIRREGLYGEKELQNVLCCGTFISILRGSHFLTGTNIFGLFFDVTSFNDLGTTLKLKFFTHSTVLWYNTIKCSKTARISFPWKKWTVKNIPLCSSTKCLNVQLKFYKPWSPLTFFRSNEGQSAEEMSALI